MDDDPENAGDARNRQVRFFAGYGRGWNVMDYRGRSCFEKRNATAAIINGLLPDRKIGVVVMLNSWKAPYLHGDVASRILDHYLGLPTKDYAAETLALMRQAEAKAAATPPPSVAALPSLDPAAYEGVYRSDLFGPIAFSSSAGGLV